MLNRVLVVVSFLAIGCAQTDPPPRTDPVVEWTLAHSDYHPSSRALRATAPRESGHATLKRGLTSQQGEIVVIEGDKELVSDFGDNQYGLVLSNQVQNPASITKRFFETFPDEFDEIVVFTTFPDAGSEGSMAWYLPIKQEVKGIGADTQDNSWWWGGDGKALHGFVNMQYIGQYGAEMGNPDHWVHSVMGQEFAHRWLSFLYYVDQSGAPSGAMLGRDKSHWAAGLQAYGSVMDGDEWLDKGDGTFRLIGRDYTFSPLDQYAMGLRGAEDVEPFFLIDDMTYKGQAIAADAQLPTGITVKGQREDIEMGQVLAAHGARAPDWTKSPHDFRIAIVLLTAPGQTTAAMKQYVERLDAFRKAFEQKFFEFTDGRGTVCTQVSGPCDAPGVTLSGYTVTEQGGNGDGVVDPGETAAIQVSVRSTGFGPAPQVSIELQEPNVAELNIITPTLDLGDIGEGATVDAKELLLIKVPPSVGCGDEAVVPVRLSTGARTFPGEIRFRIGVDTLVMDSLEDPDGWTVNAEGHDTAAKGMFEVAEPKGVDALYIGADLVTQPSEDHTPTGKNALVTGPLSGQIGDHDVDDGSTSALSPVYDLSTARDPFLTWWTWRFGYELSWQTGVVPQDASDALVTEASTDGGQTWTVLDTDLSNTQGWQKKQVRIHEKLPLGDTLRLRFTMADDEPKSIAEAMVDDIQIWDEALVCRPDLVPAEPPPVVTPPEPPVDTPPSTVPPVTKGPVELSMPVQPSGGGGCASAPGGTGPWPLCVLLLMLLVALRGLHRID